MGLSAVQIDAEENGCWNRVGDAILRIRDRRQRPAPAGVEHAAQPGFFVGVHAPRARHRHVGHHTPQRDDRAVAQGKGLSKNNFVL